MLQRLLDLAEPFWAPALVTLIGAFLNAVEQRQQALAEGDEPENWIASVLIAAGCGVLIGTCAAAIGWDGAKLMAASGVGAYMGLKGVNRIGEKFMSMWPGGRRQ